LPPCERKESSIARAKRRNVARVVASLFHALSMTATSELFTAWVVATTPLPSIHGKGIGVGINSHETAAILRCWQAWIRACCIGRERSALAEAHLCDRLDVLTRTCLTRWCMVAPCRRHAAQAQLWAATVRLRHEFHTLVERFVEVGCRTLEEDDVSFELRRHSDVRCPSRSAQNDDGSGAAATLLRHWQLHACLESFARWRAVAWAASMELAVADLTCRTVAESWSTQRATAHGLGLHRRVFVPRECVAVDGICFVLWSHTAKALVLEKRLNSLIVERQTEGKRQLAEAARLGQEVSAVCAQLAEADRRMLKTSAAALGDSVVIDTPERVTGAPRRPAVTVATALLDQLDLVVFRRGCMLAWNAVARASRARAEAASVALECCGVASRQTLEVSRLRGRASTMSSWITRATMRPGTNSASQTSPVAIRDSRRSECEHHNNESVCLQQIASPESASLPRVVVDHNAMVDERAHPSVQCCHTASRLGTQEVETQDLIDGRISSLQEQLAAESFSRHVETQQHAVVVAHLQSEAAMMSAHLAAAAAAQEQLRLELAACHVEHNRRYRDALSLQPEVAIALLCFHVWRNALVAIPLKRPFRRESSSFNAYHSAVRVLGLWRLVVAFMRLRQYGGRPNVDAAAWRDSIAGWSALTECRRLAFFSTASTRDAALRALKGWRCAAATAHSFSDLQFVHPAAVAASWSYPLDTECRVYRAVLLPTIWQPPDASGVAGPPQAHVSFMARPTATGRGDGTADSHERGIERVVYASQDME